jgi:hypothetical protein
VDECATLVAQYGPFDEPIEDSAILDPNYVGAIDASRHQLATSDTVSLGHTSPESSIDPPASSALPLPAAMDTHMPTAQPPATSSSMSLTFVRHNVPVAHIDDALLYDNPYAQTLPYGDDTPMDDN